MLAIGFGFVVPVSSAASAVCDVLAVASAVFSLGCSMASNIPTLKAPPPVIGLPEWTRTRRGVVWPTSPVRSSVKQEVRRPELKPPAPGTESVIATDWIKIGCPTCQSRFLIRRANLQIYRLRSSCDRLQKRVCWRGAAERGSPSEVGTGSARAKGTLHEAMVV